MTACHLAQPETLAQPTKPASAASTSRAACRGCSRPRARRRRAGPSVRQRRASSRKPSRGDAHVGERVVHVRVEARRDEHELGLEARNRGLDRVLEGVRGTRSSPQPARSGTFTVVSACSSGPPRAGIERPLVQRHEEDAVVAPRRSPAVPLPWWTSQSTIATRSSPSSRLRRAGRDRDVVEEAEAHRRGRRGRGAPAAGRARSRRAAPPRSPFPPRAAPPRSRLGAERVAVEPVASSSVRTRFTYSRAWQSSSSSSGRRPALAPMGCVREQAPSAARPLGMVAGRM